MRFLGDIAHISSGFFHSNGDSGIVRGEWDYGNRIGTVVNAHIQGPREVYTPKIAKHGGAGWMSRLFGGGYGGSHGPVKGALNHPTTNAAIIKAHKKASHMSPMIKYGLIAGGAFLIYKTVKG